MTKDEKIKEVMVLVEAMSESDFYSGSCAQRGDGSGALMHASKAEELEHAIESKLRELIQ